MLDVGCSRSSVQGSKAGKVPSGGFSPCPAPEPRKHPTSNIERPTSNECADAGHWMFDVGCWMLDVLALRFRGPRRAKSLPGDSHPALPLNLGNIQQPTSNTQHPIMAQTRGIGCSMSMLDVGCSRSSVQGSKARKVPSGGFSPCPAPEPRKHPTTNIEHPTSNNGADPGLWIFDVRSWMLDVLALRFGVQGGQSPFRGILTLPSPRGEGEYPPRYVQW